MRTDSRSIYFSSRKVGEVDFLVEHDGRVEPIEVKSGSHYKSHPALDGLMKKKEYGIAHATVLSNANCSKDGSIEYLPIYFTMFMERDRLPEKMLYDLKI